MRSSEVSEQPSNGKDYRKENMDDRNASPVVLFSANYQYILVRRSTKCYKLWRLYCNYRAAAPLHETLKMTYCVSCIRWSTQSAQKFSFRDTSTHHKAGRSTPVLSNIHQDVRGGLPNQLSLSKSQVIFKTHRWVPCYSLQLYCEIIVEEWWGAQVSQTRGNWKSRSHGLVVLYLCYITQRYW